MRDKQLRMTINIPVYSNIQKIAQDGAALRECSAAQRDGI
jgi:hypothetical protein